GDVERAGLRHLPNLEVREVELDAARLRIHVEVKVVLAGDVGAGPLTLLALAAHARAIRIFEDREQLAKLQLLFGEAARRRRFGARAQAALVAHLAAGRGRLEHAVQELVVAAVGKSVAAASTLVVVVHAPSSSCSRAQRAYSRSPAPPEAPEENARALAAR